jgi:hypothetical protein
MQLQISSGGVKMSLSLRRELVKLGHVESGKKDKN